MVFRIYFFKMCINEILNEWKQYQKTESDLPIIGGGGGL
jgi:hypothetical protein